jgi:hypothetical protein
MQNALPSIARGGASPAAGNHRASRIMVQASVVRGAESLCSPASDAGEPETVGSKLPFHAPICRELMQIICQQLAPVPAILSRLSASPK